MSPDPTIAAVLADEAIREKVPQSTNTSSFLEFEESIAGKPGGKWVTADNSAILSALAILLSLSSEYLGACTRNYYSTVTSNLQPKPRHKAQAI